MQTATMECRCKLHVGPRWLPADAEHFMHSQYSKKLYRTCLRCHRLRVARRLGGPMWTAYEANRRIDARRVALILRGPQFGVPLRLPPGLLVCSRCFQIKSALPRFFQDPYCRVEPVCKKCQKENHD